MIIKTPEPPYYAVIFSSYRTEDNVDYEHTMKILMEASKNYDEFLGMESARDGFGISVSYWKTYEGILRWKKDSDHLIAKEIGKKYWYESYAIRIARVEYQNYFEKKNT
jgi:heme-degrading monooxygenase HmoA